MRIRRQNGFGYLEILRFLKFGQPLLNFVHRQLNPDHAGRSNADQIFINPKF